MVEVKLDPRFEPSLLSWNRGSPKSSFDVLGTADWPEMFYSRKDFSATRLSFTIEVFATHHLDQKTQHWLTATDQQCTV